MKKSTTIDASYHHLTADELIVLSQLQSPTPVNMVLDKTAVGFLLSLNTNNRNVSASNVRQLKESFCNNGWKCSETLCVTSKAVLGNGQHRLIALTELGYPAKVHATVVFGVDDVTVLTLDQHQKRSAPAALKIRTGKSYSSTLLGTVRAGICCNTNPGRMYIGTDVLKPERLQYDMPLWTVWFDKLPLLFTSRKVGTSTYKLTSAEALAVVHYSKRAGTVMANRFLNGFFGEMEVSTDSPEHKALMFHVTAKRAP
ncbi:MAG: hypothetical protein ACRC2T_10630, partial [Thermoguttaceae bacterium]